MNKYIKMAALPLLALAACHQRPIPTDHQATSAQLQAEEVATGSPLGTVNEIVQEPAVEPVPATPIFSGTLPVTTPPVPEGLSSISAQECNACHFDTHESWAGSDHQRGWSRRVSALSQEVEASEGFCDSCHLPIESQHMTVTDGDGEAAQTWDPTLQQEGVTCAACHVRDGTIYGVHASDNAPHPVTGTTELQSSEFCSTCHQLSWPDADRPIYDTYGEWSRSWYAEAGITCQTCHMRPTPGVATAGELGYYADHSTSINPSRAITLQAELASNIYVRGVEFSGAFSITNPGAGHSFPTGSPFKAVVITATLVDADQELAADPFTATIERVVQEVPPWNTLSDNTLSPNESHTWQFAFTPSYRAKAGLGTLLIEVAFRDSSGHNDEPFTSQSIPVTLR